ncbi:MAG: RNA polymerase sporulation sigma factor SigK [Bacilli bacterium]|nr:RNA polymerase sporulation sigma factor SigK [Bacilli bacterium]
MFFLTNILNLLSLFHGSYSINVFPEPLSKEEEEKHINNMIKGDINSRNTLIEHNLRLVAHIVKKFEKLDNNADDLISIGTIGLIKGIDSFKPDKNNRLTTYVARCIENEILMHFRSNKKNNNNVSLNDSIGYDKDGNEINLIDVIKSDSEDILNIIHNKDNQEYINKILNILNDREREIIIKRFGLFDTDELTQKEIASSLNISRSYVSRIEKRAISKLYREFKKNKKEL